ncbi:hypothetical protein ACJRO7_033571 [Eucalyptus globulus]|uniref:Uncharacterized protein n=1 Tax=Eucalyptus globulus TaxID=34317 RepID=A0ABD3JNH6_EUCGL
MAAKPQRTLTSQPESPLLKWKIEDEERNVLPVDGRDDEDSKLLMRAGRRSRRKKCLAVFEEALCHALAVVADKGRGSQVWRQKWWHLR